jgi:hypothetical protein
MRYEPSGNYVILHIGMRGFITSLTSSNRACPPE